ncbi:FG-GAP-like repeat-containing protein [Streptomyces sp. NBC_01336]|uniref:FG-GAP-like repeat-containing protein n=1 Tax=Streptomyces sp. NBC_01336 TaxID=2903829 RepID=UPI002E14065D|nr:FG-GAP-like repeat-containing protein [Streptomyces sp. NBC_01336]
MKRRFGIVGTALLCAVFGVQGPAVGAGVERPATVVSQYSSTDPDWPAVSSTSMTGSNGGPRAATASAAGTAPHHDYNGDGRSDMASWYDYSDGHDAIHTFTARADGGFAPPAPGWETPKGKFWAEHMKRVTGDFNGDGIGDVAAFYGYDTGKVSLFTWLGTGNGTFADYVPSWSVEPGNWTFDAITAQAGDFDGDGRDDIAAWYDYRNGDDKLFTFLANPDGGFAVPFSSFARTDADGWEVERMKFATGDYDGDGRDDLGVLDSYTAGTVRLMAFSGKPDGGFAEPVSGWEADGWQFDRVSVVSGDFDGNGRDEFATWYDYADGRDALFGFGLDAAGRFGGQRELLNATKGDYDRARMYLVSGDYNGDGRADVGALYGYEGGLVAALTFTARADGTLVDALHSWQSTPIEYWTFARVATIERYNSSLPACPAVFGHGGYPDGADSYDRDQIRQPNHPTGLAQQKSWGASGVEADLRLTKDGTKAVMWHNNTTRGLTGNKFDIAEMRWATGADQLKGRKIAYGPYAGETVYTFREWLDSARSKQMAAFVELKKETKPLLLHGEESVSEAAWNEVIAPIAEKAATQRIMIYTLDDELRPELVKRVTAAGLGASLENYPHWIDDPEFHWEEPAPEASYHFAYWQYKLNKYGSPVNSVPMATSWTSDFTTWLNGKCR